MIIQKGQNGEEITLESYQISRTPDSPVVEVVADLIVVDSSLVPSTMRVRVEYQYDDIPPKGELEFGKRILGLLKRRFG